MVTSSWIESRMILGAGHSVVIGVPQPEHIDELVANMREEDLREITRYSDQSPGDVALDCITRSAVSHVCLINDRVAGMWGMLVPQLLSGEGYPWALTTNVIWEHKRIFLILSRGALEEARRLCPVGMTVEVDASYGAAVRWLEWMGFKAVSERDVNGYPFIMAVSTAKEAA